MRYVVFGAGAIGGAIGGRLLQHGHDVALVARGAHAEAMGDRGLELRSPQGTVLLRPPVAEDPAAFAPAPGDVVILAVKSQDTPAALDALVAAADPGVAIICAQNGVENERLALRRFAAVYGMCVMLPASHLEPGVVEIYATPVSGILDVGRYPSGSDPRAERIAADLYASTFASQAVVDVMSRKYSKLLLNLGNAIEAACGSAARGGELYARARAEAEACFEAAGIRAATEEDAERRTVMSMKPIDGRRRGGGSSWQSLARGASRTEVDHLNGEVVLLGRLHGVDTPVNQLLQRTLSTLAHQRAAPGSLAPEDLLGQLEGAPS